MFEKTMVYGTHTSLHEVPFSPIRKTMGFGTYLSHDRWDIKHRAMLYELPLSWCHVGHVKRENHATGGGSQRVKKSWLWVT